MESEKALCTALQSIETLKRFLPRSYDSAACCNLAAFHLVEIMNALTPALTDYLQTAPKHEKDWNPSYHPVIASSLAGQAVDIANALIPYAQQNNDSLKLLLETRNEWPAIISTDPSRDIRKVQKNTGGKAAALYKPILDHLGKNDWMHTECIKNQGIFHTLAKDAVEIISSLYGSAGIWRLRGLPWLLDYRVGAAKFNVLTSDIRAADNDIEGVAAMKYFLYLSLAPEPDRTRLRKHWRKLREEFFASLSPSGAEASRLHRKLNKCEPLEIPKHDSSGGQSLEYPFALHDEDLAYDKPWWHFWWQLTLKYEPAAFFGNAQSLVDWEDESVREVISAPQVRGRAMSGFGRCIDKVLNAFLTFKGDKNGLRDISTKLPRFQKTWIGYEDPCREVKSMRAFFENLPQSDI